MCKRKKQQHDKFSIIQKTSFCIIAFFMSTTNVFAKGLFDKSDADVINPALMHRLAEKPPLPRAHKDFSQYRFCPPGDKLQEQADSNRLLFWTPDGRPDGYAQRRGGSIIYYNAQGKAIRVQHLTSSEIKK